MTTDAVPRAPLASVGRGSIEETVDRPMRSGEDPAPTVRDAERTTASVPAEPEVADAGLEPGRALAGRYLVIKQLGAGGMGAVYKAYDPDLDRKVAIKLLHGHAVGEAQTRLLREAQAMAKLSHANVVPIFDVGVHEDRVFIAMDLVEGTDLRLWMKTPRRWPEVVEVFAQAGAGLAAAHAVGLVHRDFKPDNVLLSTDAATGRLRAQVADFGLARFDEETAAPAPRAVEVGMSSALDARLTRYGAIVGTPAYMSPEQHAGVAVDHRTDQFSFCVALFEALYGKRPYGGATLEELGDRARSGQREPPPRGSDVPRWLHRLCLRGLQPDREARFPRMDVLLAELAAGRGRRQRRALVLGGAALAAAVAAGTAWAMTGPGACAGATERTAAVWYPGRRATIEAAFTATGVPYASDAWTGAAGLVDRYVNDWKNMYEESCAATHLRGEQSTELMDLRTACLQQRLRDVDALLNMFQEADAKIVKRATDAALALPGLEACADVEALRSGTLARRGAGDPGRIEALRERLRATRARVNAGGGKEALAELEAAVSEAIALDDPGLTAAARLTLAKAQRNAGVDEAARDSAAAAVWQAVADRDDETLWEALEEQIVVVGYKLGRRAEAQPWIDHAEALLRRRGQPDRERAEWLQRLGMVEIAAGNNAGAEAPLTEGLALAERVHGPDHPGLIRHVNVLGGAKLRGGKYAEAQALFERAIALGERAYGSGHPDLALPLNNLALAYERQNRHDEAIVALQRSREIFAAINPKDPNIGLIRQNIGGMLQLSGRPQEALVELRAALAHLEATLGPDHIASSGTYTFLGDTYRDLGDYPAARAAYERGCGLREQVLGAEHADLALCLLGQAQIDMLEDKGAESLAHVERALKLVEKGSPDPVDLGLMHLTRAKALQATGKGEQAREAAAAARASLTTAGVPGERGLRELAAWEAGL